MKVTSVDLRSWEPLDESPTPPGPALQMLRDSLGLRRSDLARNLGRQNVSKFCNRLTDFERGRRKPNPQDCTELDRAMRLETGTVAQLWAGIDAMERVHHRVRVRILNREMELLRSYHSHLTQQREVILSTPHLANARVAAARLQLLWAGGGCFTVGELLTGWANGHLLHPTISGERAKVVSAHGSALSGLRGVVVLDTDPNLLGPRPTALSFRKALSTPRPAPSPLSFSDVLAAIGVEVPDMVIRGANGDAIARYSHRERIVYDLHGRPLLTASNSDCPTRQSTFSEVKIGGRPIPEQSGVLRGAWTGEQWRTSTDCIYKDGRIVQDGRTILWLDAVPPPGLIKPLTLFLT